jgi:hypothetical protein
VPPQLEQKHDSS